MTRQEFVARLGLGAAVFALGAAAPTISFWATRNGTVASETLAKYRCIMQFGGRLFVKVGRLAGDLQYLVNGWLPLLPAVQCSVRTGDRIVWRQV